jgi:starch-binding outer membrane protein, SusD/RagB family
MTKKRLAPSWWAAPTRTARAMLAVAAFMACSPDRILEVEDIDVALPPAVQDSSALPSLLAGAIGDFGTAYNGNTQSSGLGLDLNQITLSGQISDELINTETFPTRIEVDQRRQQYTSNGSLRDAFYAIQQARASADRAVEAYVKFGSADVGHAEALNLSALSYILMAENYCGAVPISKETSPGVFEYGAPQTANALLTRAVEKADSALVIASNAAALGSAAAKATQARVARIAKARALLNLDRPTDAAAAIVDETTVPTTFQYFFKHSELTGRQNNGTWLTTISVGRFGVADREGVNGLPFRSEGDVAGTVRDPRVSNQRRAGAGLGFDGVTPQWMQLKYSKRDTLAIIADGVEARLIQAEAAYEGGSYANALTILNALRSNAALFRLRGYLDANQQPLSLPPLLPAATAAEQENQIFKERAYWLYLTSHRLGDLRRLVRQYSRPDTTVFPTGAYHKPGTYGRDVNSPIPQAEDNNPNFVRSACVTTQA